MVGTASLGRITFRLAASFDSSGEKGCLSLKATLSLLVAVTESTSAKSPARGDFRLGSLMRFMEYTTSLASSVRPLWNFTPGRSRNVQVSLSALARQL